MIDSHSKVWVVSGVTVEAFSQSEKLSSFFDVLSTAQDRQGKEYVNTIEGKMVRS